MKKSKLLRSLALMVFSSVISLATTINSGTISASAGTPVTASFLAFTTGTATMTGLVVTVTWADATTKSCSWNTGCSVASFFTASEVDGANGTYNGTWSIVNSRAASNITSIVLDGASGGPHVGFDLNWSCANNTAGTFASCANVTNSANGNEGTPSSNIGWTVATAAGGTASPSPTSIIYSNIIGPAGGGVIGGTQVGDEYAKLTFNFGAGFTNGQTLAFRADTDSIASAAPEPTSMLLVGTGLLLAGYVGKRRSARKS